MPLIRIDVTKGKGPQSLRAIADAIHEAVVESYGIPVRDRFQVLTEHEPGSIIAQDAGLGFERDNAVIVQIFTQRGRSDEAKQRLYAAIAARLVALGVLGSDVFISYVENGAADWSFGFGRAQYLTGELAVPSTSPSGT